MTKSRRPQQPGKPGYRGRPRGGKPGKPGGPRERKPRVIVVPTLSGPSGFSKLGITDDLAAVLQKQGINDPFPIQEATIPDALAGKDILGRGRTGSGKTLAFGLTMVQRLAKGAMPGRRRSPRGLILVPTRELADQVMTVLQPLADVTGLDLVRVIGGASYDKQINRLTKGTDIIVATPGRLYDLVERGAADLAHINIVVIDEADQMADFGFLPQVSVLLDEVPTHGQRMLFSATLDRGVDELVRRYLKNPVEHATDPGKASVTTMDHKVMVVPQKNKAKAATDLARAAGRTIVFVRTRISAEEVAEMFIAAGVPAMELHGGMSQRARMRALEGFKAGRTKVLVATDVAARGIHVDGIDLVLQMDPPNDHKDYLHRAGRTARAGASGTVVTITTPTQQRRVSRMLQSAGVTANVEHSHGSVHQPEAGSRAGSARHRARPQYDKRKQGGSRPAKHRRAS